MKPTKKEKPIIGLEKKYSELSTNQRLGFWGVVVPAIGVVAVFIGWVVVPIFNNLFSVKTPNPSPIIPTSTPIDPFPSVTSSITQNPTDPPQIVASTTIPNSSFSIAITEVMASPCKSGFPSSNEYIELYNYGDEPINVGSWMFSLSGENVVPDEIVSWKSRNDYGLGTDVIIDSTIIQPKQFAIILPSNYHVSTEEIKMPYSFPPKTVILTMKEGTYLVDETFGIQGWASTTQVSGAYLYVGTSSRIDQVISTYGISVEGLSPKKQTNYRDQMPIGTEKCYSVQRRIASGPDTIGNWEIAQNGNPGLGTDEY